MYRFFGNLIDDSKIELSEHDSHHYLKVLRITEDEIVEVSANNLIYNTVFEEYKNNKVILRIINRVDSFNESDVRLTLIQSIIKSDKMEAAIKGAIEAGVCEIKPLIAKRSVSDIEKKADKKIERWQKICEVAAKQSKRDYIPQISMPITVEDLKNFDGEIIVCYENEDNVRFTDLNIASKNIALVIGPEGGFEEFEIKKLKDYGAHLITLGKRILRAETAAIVSSYHIIACLEGE